MAAIVFTLLFIAGGLAMVRLILPRKNPVIRVWLGVALGFLLLMTLPALCAHALRFSLMAHYAAAVLLAALVGVCYLLRERSDCAPMQEEDWRFLRAMALLVLPLTVLSAYLQHTHMVQPMADGSYWCGQSTYGDLCMHMAFAASMRDMAFPPTYSLLYGTALSYPYLIDALSTTMLLFGMDMHMALVFPGTVMMALTYVGYMILAREILGGRNKAILAAALLFFLNGGLGFLYDFDLMGRDGFAKISEIFTGYYKTPANQPDVNLRWSNVIADLLVPQRALMGGWAMGIPALYLLISSVRARSMRQTVALALWASCLPLVHTHTFLALGLFSGGLILGRLIMQREKRKGIFARAGVYLGIVLVLAMPQLLGNAIRQTVDGGVIKIQFNWVNNNGGMRLIDGYLWFWLKNVGLPFLLILGACFNARRRGQLDVLCGMAAIFIVADWVLFQRNPYDNNKLFYIWYMFGAILAADYGSVIMQRLAGLGGRNVLCALFMIASVLSGSLSLAREAISGYQLFSANAVAAGAWIDENTDRDAVFLTGQQHINPVVSLAGRQILCGSDLYVYFHGLSYSQQSRDCERFYEAPMDNEDVIARYGVDYIYVSDYERADFAVDYDALDDMYDLVYENPDVRIYQVN